MRCLFLPGWVALLVGCHVVLPLGEQRDVGQPLDLGIAPDVRHDQGTDQPRQDATADDQGAPADQGLPVDHTGRTDGVPPDGPPGTDLTVPADTASPPTDTAPPVDGPPATGWSEMVVPTTSALFGVWGRGANDVYAVGTNSTVLRYTPSTGWKAIGGLPPALELRGVWTASGDDIFVAGERGTALRWDGTGWSGRAPSTGQPHLLSVWGRTGQDLFAAGKSGTVLRYTRSSGSWSQEPTYWTMTPPDLTGVGGAGSRTYAVGTDGAALMHNSTTGPGWADISWPLSTGGLTAVSASTSRVVAVGASGSSSALVLRRVPGTGSWTKETLALASLPTGVWVNPQTNADVVVTKGGKVLLIKQGLGAKDLNAPGSTQLNAVWSPGGAQDPPELFVVGEGGLILHYTPPISP